MRAIGVLALGLTLSAAATAASTRPLVRVTDLKPFTVHGLRFGSDEHLRVVVTTTKRTVRRLDASGRGTFTLKFPHVKVRRCGQYSVAVYGRGRLRAAVKSPPQACAVPLTP